MRTLLTPTLLLAGVLVLGACGGDGASAEGDGGGNGTGGGGPVTVVAVEFSYDPADLSLPADTDTDLTLQNDGVIEHDIVVEELDDRELIYAGPGETVTETVNVPAGSYTLYCSIPGHREAGMEGSLTVE